MDEIELYQKWRHLLDAIDLSGVKVEIPNIADWLSYVKDKENTNMEKDIKIEKADHVPELGDIIYVDMDGVIANFNLELNKITPELELHDGPGYDERSKLVDKACQDHPGVFLRLEPMPGGSIEAVKKLAEHYEIYFLSTPMSDLYESYAHKPEWLRRHFGDWAKKRLILTHRKDLQQGKFLIDDRTKNGAGEFRGKHIHFATDPKFKNWDAVLKYFIKE